MLVTYASHLFALSWSDDDSYYARLLKLRMAWLHPFFLFASISFSWIYLESQCCNLLSFRWPYQHISPRHIAYWGQNLASLSCLAWHRRSWCWRRMALSFRRHRNVVDALAIQPYSATLRFLSCLQRTGSLWTSYARVNSWGGKLSFYCQCWFQCWWRVHLWSSSWLNSRTLNELVVYFGALDLLMAFE